MKVGDRIRVVTETHFHKVGDEGVIEEIDYHFQHKIVVRFPNQTNLSIFPIRGHCVSLLYCDNSQVVYEVIND